MFFICSMKLPKTLKKGNKEILQMHLICKWFTCSKKFTY